MTLKLVQNVNILFVLLLFQNNLKIRVGWVENVYNLFLNWVESQNTFITNRNDALINAEHFSQSINFEI